MFEKIQNFYVLGLWTKEQVRAAVLKGKITADEYKIITKEDFKE